jgi:hypothetical protein
VKKSQFPLAPAKEQKHSTNSLVNSEGLAHIQRKRVLKNFDIGYLMAYLQSVDLNTSEAKLNEISLDDNNGGRILY